MSSASAESSQQWAVADSEHIGTVSAPVGPTPESKVIDRHDYEKHRVGLPQDDSVFSEIDADKDIDRISTIRSACLRCGGEGDTRLLLTRIPYFKDVVIMSFECDECGVRNSEVQPANELQDKGVRFTLKSVPSESKATQQDLNRQVIKSETCSIRIPEAEFEIPPNERRGDINTIEGVLTNIADALEADQPNRELEDEEVAAKIQKVIDRFRGFISGAEAFTFILEDPAGNSFLENPNAPSRDPRGQVEFFTRTREQTEALGFAVEALNSEMKEAGFDVDRSKLKPVSLSDAFQGKLPAGAATTGRGARVDKKVMERVLDTYFNVDEKTASMYGACNACGAECETRMCITDIPYFADVVLMVTECDKCGFKDSEVKPVGSVKDKALKVTLKVTTVDDLKRDLLKSDTASIAIPELELELLAGTLGAKYTTLEGILLDIKSQLTRFNPFALGDSSQDDPKAKMQEFIDSIDALFTVEKPWTFIIDDPMGNSFVYTPLGKPENDPNMKVEKYERTHEQKEELGLNDINTDDYMTEEQKAELVEALEKEHEELLASLTPEELEAFKKQEVEKASEDTQQKIERMKELKASKLGGLISVDEAAQGF